MLALTLTMLLVATAAMDAALADNCRPLKLQIVAVARVGVVAAVLPTAEDVAASLRRLVSVVSGTSVAAGSRSRAALM